MFKKRHSVLLHGCLEFTVTHIQTTTIYPYSFISLKQENVSPLVDSHAYNRSEDAAKTIYVSGLKNSTSQDSISYFFENKKRTGGGDLCERKIGFMRTSPTRARLKFVSSKGIIFR